MTKKFFIVALFALQMTAVSSIASAPADEEYPTCFPCLAISSTKTAPAVASVSAPADEEYPTCFPCNS